MPPSAVPPSTKLRARRPGPRTLGELLLGLLLGVVGGWIVGLVRIRRP